MVGRWSGLAVAALVCATSTANAAGIDDLLGKFAFNWRSDPGKERCVKVAEPLLATFKSGKYRCDLKPKSNTASGASVRTCTEAGARGKEYLIFDTQKACNEERKTQESNG